MEKFNSLAGLLPFSVLREEKKNPAIKVKKVPNWQVCKKTCKASRNCIYKEDWGKERASCICGIRKKDLFPDQ